MASLTIYTYLVHPGKGVNPELPLSGKKLVGANKLIDLLANIFHSQPGHRDFEVTFRHAEDGTQQNDCRDLIIAHAASPSASSAKSLAARLQRVTDRRSGMGLVFVITGQHGTKRRTVISRFPANEAILAEVNEDSLDVEFLEQVFIRQMTAYKAILLEANIPLSGYWSGYATDRQAGGAPENISGYWIEDFLTADFSETPKAGTNRLAMALKNAVKANPDLSVKAEIASAVSLAPTALKDKAISIDGFFDHFGLSQNARDTILAQLSKPSLSSKSFKFDPTEFKKKVPYRSVEMESGAILTAPTSDFDKVFDIEEESDGKVRYSTEGRVTDQRMTRQ